MIIRVFFTEEDKIISEDEIDDKGHRSDILVQDELGRLYELNFVTLSRLIVDLENNIKFGKNYFTDVGLIVVKKITKEDILIAIRQLKGDPYIRSLKPVELEVNKDWYTLSI